MSNLQEFALLSERLPFLTYGIYGVNNFKEEHIGIVQTADDVRFAMYCLDMIQNEKQRDDFISCGQMWWNESNRQMPINLFLIQQFRQFKPFLRVFNAKHFEVQGGPTLNFKEVTSRRAKRRVIQIVDHGALAGD